MSSDTEQTDSIAIQEAQLILAEKRTSLAVMRTGIAVLALPLSVMGLLVATSRYYDALQVLHLLIPLGVLVVALIILGSGLIIRSAIRLRHFDRLIHEIKVKHGVIGDYLE